MPDRSSARKPNTAGIIRIIGFLLPVLFLLLIPILGQQAVSDTENRTLETFPVFDITTFVSGTFQDRLEHALADQYPGGETVKASVLCVQNSISSLESKIIGTFSGNRGTYVEIRPGYYHYAEDQARIVEKVWPEERYASQLSQGAELFNRLTGVKKYVYFVRNSRSMDFTLSDGENNRIPNAIRNLYDSDGFGCFSADGYPAFCEVFYQTDHHWNAAGSDRAYREILLMLFGGTEEPLPHSEPVTYNVIFNGSYSRQAGILCSEEPFTVYCYDFPAMKILLDGKKGQYGHRSLYEKQKYPTDELRNHYAYYYGGDYGEIRIDNGTSHGRNLLLVADSYSNPINLLLASHFDTTCIVDPRYYETFAGHPFDPCVYVAENGIDTVLWLGDIIFFTGSGEKEAAD